MLISGMVKPARSTRKRLSIESFSKCNPARKRRTRKCLPSDMYKAAESSTTDMGDHAIIDIMAGISENEKKELRKYYLRPRSPSAWKKNPNTWLDNFNIEDVMKQYSEKFPFFKFIGVFPIDFSAPNPYTKHHKTCLYPDLCNIKLKTEYENGTRCMGVIFNLDPHFKGGSHWVALYIDIHDIRRPWCGYFDSYGYAPPKLVSRLMKSFRLQIPSIKLMYNSRKFQYGGSECGMYSIYYIISMIHGVRFKNFCRHAVSDSFMTNLRSVLFSK